MAKLARVRQITNKDNYVWLLLSLMLLFFGGALAEQLGNEIVNRIMGASLTAIILVAVWSLERGRFNLSSRIGITAIFIIIEGGEYLLNIYHLGTIQLVTMLVFVILTITICSRQVLLTGAVDGNKIVGAICIYFLMGMAWALAYLLVEFIFPGSIPNLGFENWRSGFQEALYYSYITLTTVGYGDISPVQPVARYLTFMQAITGQFYVAIVVASLIGARMTTMEGASNSGAEH